MKIALLSDIHGNLPALEAVLRHASGQSAVQTILNLGDLTGYGPNPEEVVRWSQGSQILNIQGNYDKKVISKVHRDEKWQSVKTPDKREMFAWTHRSLSKQSRKYLGSLPESRSVEIGGLRLLITHGSPASHTEHLRPDTPEVRLAELAATTDAAVILCGHSHRAFIREVNETTFINPGSVGRPDDGDPRASYAILDIDEGTLSAQLFKVPYDIMAAVGSMRRTGMPEIFTQILRQGLNYDDVAAKLGETPARSGVEPNGSLTLMTDFGLKDHFVGVMKGVIFDIAPQVRVTDISHQVSPQNIMEGARMLAEATPFFSPGTVHVAVVDPGVGTQRRAIAAQIGAQFFVAPDNGLLSPLIEKAQTQHLPVKIVVLNQPKYWLPKPSHSFHGRDIFAPVGAHLANGLLLEKLGNAISDPVMLPFPQPEFTPTGLHGEIVWVDVFGNLSTNIPGETLPIDTCGVEVKILGETIQGITRAFGDAQPGTLIATIDSASALSISVVNGSAKKRLNANTGDSIEVIFNQ